MTTNCSYSHSHRSTTSAPFHTEEICQPSLIELLSAAMDYELERRAVVPSLPNLQLLTVDTGPSHRATNSAAAATAVSSSPPSSSSSHQRQTLRSAIQATLQILEEDILQEQQREEDEDDDDDDHSTGVN